MPGIVGIVSPKPAAECRRILDAMIGSMRHSRHYVSGTYSVPEMGIYAGWIAQDKAFAPTRISQSRDGDIALLLSGECFTDSSLEPASLKQQRRDPENENRLLVDLYDQQQETFFARLNGLFSGLLIDKKRGTAFLLNDRYGSERIYWHRKDKDFYFASEAKALLTVLPGLREFDREGVAQFLAYGCTIEWRTIFRGVHLLPGGSLLVFQQGNCKEQRYFNQATWTALPSLPEGSFAARFEEVFRRILPRYVKSPDGLGISLTGGLDTRMIVACLPNSSRRPVLYTFTGQTGTTLDDRIAAKVARAANLDHYLLRLGSDFLPKFASHADRTVLITDGCLGITGAHEIYLNEQARELASVRLTGLVGSEILRGISTFKLQRFSPSLLSPEYVALVADAEARSRAQKPHPIAAAAFRNVPWNLFGGFAASRSQMMLRTPFLDNDLVALAFQVPESLRKSPRPGLDLVAHNNHALARIPTDRRIEDREGGFLRRWRRRLYEITFKIDYLYNEGMPAWLCPYDSILRTLNSPIKIFGHHKFLHYRSWFRNELAEYIMSVLTDPQTQGKEMWSGNYLAKIGQAHIQGRRNHSAEINAVLTLEAVERLLFRDLPREPSTVGSFAVQCEATSCT